MGWFGGLGAAVQEAIAVAVLAVIVTMALLLGVSWLEIKGLKSDLEDTHHQLATCSASVAQFKLTVGNQNVAIEQAKADGDRRVAVAQAAARAAQAQARTMAARAQVAEAAARNAKPDNPSDLCGSAQRANAQFIKERQ